MGILMTCAFHQMALEWTNQRGYVCRSRSKHTENKMCSQSYNQKICRDNMRATWERVRTEQASWYSRFSLFCDVTQGWLAVTVVAGQPVPPTFNGQAVCWTVANLRSALRNISEERIYAASEAWNHSKFVFFHYLQVDFPTTPIVLGQALFWTTRSTNRWA